MRTSLLRPYFRIWGEETLKLLAEATVWEDERCPASSAGPGASNPVFAMFRQNLAGTSVGVFAQRFRDPGAEDDLMFDVQHPHSIRIGSTLYPHIHWSPNDAVVADVGWGIEYSEANINTIFPVTTSELIAFPTSGVQYSHDVSSWSPIPLADRGISGMFKARIFRSDAGGIDTYAAVAWLHEFDIHFEVDTMGSRTEFTK